MKNFFSQFNSLKGEEFYLSLDDFQTNNSGSKNSKDQLCRALAYPVEGSDDY